MLAIPLIRKKVNTIYYCLGELVRINKKIRAKVTELAKLKSNRRELSKYP